MKSIHRKATTPGLLLLIFLCGCAGKASVQPLAYEMIKPGATLVLNEAIRFPAYNAAVNIQNGKVKGGLFSIDNYHPNCRLELYSQSPNARIINPDRFTIYKIHTNIEYVMNKPVMLAGRGWHMADGTTDQIYITILYLKSEKQAEVELLSCQHWEDPGHFPTHLSLDQIKQTLDGLFIVEN